VVQTSCIQTHQTDKTKISKSKITKHITTNYKVEQNNKLSVSTVCSIS